MGRYGPNRCPSCGGKPAFGKVSCQKCLDRRKTSRLNKPTDICTQCSNPSVPGKTRCIIHLATNVERQLLKHQNNLISGLCRCGSTPKDGCNSCQSCIDKVMTRNRNQMARLRVEIFKYYGDKCVCCDIDTVEFLTLDHINGGGREHRKTIGCGISFYRWVKQHFPDDIQILCWNCNCAKSNHISCPHQSNIYNEPTSAQKSIQKLRSEVIQAYGGCCVCCGEDGEPFLNLDHVNGDGSTHRKTINQTASSTIYRWARNNNFPNILQLLCWNCNIARYIYGECPHQRVENV